MTERYTVSNNLTGVLIPTTRQQLPEFEKLCLLWSIYNKIEQYVSHSSYQQEVSLIVTFDCGFSKSLYSKIHEIFYFYDLNQVFSQLVVGFCDIDSRDNRYIKKGQSFPSYIPELGLKSGPNIQFFRSLREFCESENTIFLNETDCFPLSSNWLSQLRSLVKYNQQFWIMGSPYRGRSKLGPIEVSHINGNALYGVGIDGFDCFLQRWEKGLIQLVNDKPNIAYDVFFTHYFSSLFNNKTWEGVSEAFIEEFMSYLCKVKYTEFIHNLGGDKEIRGDSNINLIKYMQNHPYTQIIHGKFLYQQILSLAVQQLELYELRDDKIKEWLVNCSVRMWQLGQYDTVTNLGSLLYK